LVYGPGRFIPYTDKRLGWQVTVDILHNTADYIIHR